MFNVMDYGLTSTLYIICIQSVCIFDEIHLQRSSISMDITQTAGFSGHIIIKAAAPLVYSREQLLSLRAHSAVRPTLDVRRTYIMAVRPRGRRAGRNQRTVEVHITSASVSWRLGVIDARKSDQDAKYETGWLHVKLKFSMADFPRRQYFWKSFPFLFFSKQQQHYRIYRLQQSSSLVTTQ